MKKGKLYGIGVGPGDAELMTVKGARLISECSDIFVPKAKTLSESVALEIAGQYINEAAVVHELVFPMTADKGELEKKWNQAAGELYEVLCEGKDVCFLTLGDPLLYSTYIYLIRSLKSIDAEMSVETVPGIMALNAAAAITDFTIGEGKEPVTIVPTADDLGAVRDAIKVGGTVVLMKIGKRLQAILDVLEETGTLESSVFVSRAGQKDQAVETDLRKLKDADEKAGYLSIILTHVPKETS